MRFREQAEKFMNEIGTRKRNPVRRATLATYRSLLNKHILPAIGDWPLEGVQNGLVKQVVNSLSATGKSPQTINLAVGIIKAVVKSATDENGNQLYPRTWNNEFMDIPAVVHAEQHAPTPTSGAVQKALDASEGQFKALIALLAGTGLRIGEALALKIIPDNGKDSCWIPQTGTLIIRSTVAKGKIQYTPKTAAGVREIDLHPELNDFLRVQINVSKDGFLFHNNQEPWRSNSTALYSALHAAKIPGFHALRRFRLTHLDREGASRGFIKASAGHCNKDVTDRYVDSNVDVASRKKAAETYGLGFQLEASR